MIVVHRGVRKVQPSMARNPRFYSRKVVILNDVLGRVEIEVNFSGVLCRLEVSNFDIWVQGNQDQHGDGQDQER